MKRTKYLLLLILASALLLFGCGKKGDPKDPVPPADETVDSGNTEGSDTDQTDTSEPEQPEEPEEDLPPAEGMVRSKLTNEWIPEEQASARPIAVMMPTDKVAQPQYNIGKADIIYECMEEGGVTRQLAVIDDWQELEKIGNIRSCRDYYYYMACEWDPILIHVGGVYFMQPRLNQGDIQYLSENAPAGAGSKARGSAAFFRSDDRKRPHNCYVSAEGVLKAMKKLDYPLEHREEYYVPDHFVFSKETNTLSDFDDAIDAPAIDLSNPYPYSESYLEYNEEDGLYYKYLHGVAQIDAVSDEQLSFANVIIQTAYSEKRKDADGSTSKYLAFQMHDTTRTGYYVTQGKAIKVRWEKTSDYEPTRYYDMDGNEIELNTGKTYIAIIQEEKEPSFKINPKLKDRVEE